MLPNERLQSNRFELKYLISPRQALAVRDFVRSLLTLDPYMNPAQPDGYMVYSAYVDSPTLMLCRATVDGEKNRYKLRVRFYDDNPDHPVFFEIKRRVNDAILKSRATVRRDRAMELLRGRGPRETDLVNPRDTRGFAALGNFCLLRDKLTARPAALVAYRREAYMSTGDNSARLTLDRELCGAEWTDQFGELSGERWRPVPIEHVILELKFTQRFPLWMGELVRRLDLQRISMPKYVECISALREPRFSPAGRIGRLAVAPA